MSVRNCEADCEFQLSQLSKEGRYVYLRGWSEAMMGMPYPRQYDGENEGWQHIYEFGRLDAANVRLAKLPAIIIKTAGKRDIGLAEALANRAARIAGNPIPPEVAVA